MCMFHRGNQSVPSLTHVYVSSRQPECTFTNACLEPQGAFIACCKMQQCIQLLQVAELAAAVRACDTETCVQHWRAVFAHAAMFPSDL